MAKKVLTPEEYKAKIDKKADKRKRFGKTFLTTFAFALACVVVFASMAIAFTPNNGVSVSSGNNGGNNVVSSGSDNVSSGDNNGGSNVADVPGDDNNNGGSDAADVPGDGNNATDNKDNNANSGNGDAAASNGGDTKKELSNSSTAADVVAYFNTAINKVKPNAKKITLNKEVNSPAGSIEGNLPKTLTNMADSLIAKNMGEKDLSTLDPGMVNATTVAQKNAMFPVENESWSSKLTADDVAKFDVKDNGNSYTITLYIKDDEPSTSTAHGQGHNGKVFSVIMPSIVTDNAGPAASVIKDVKTGHKNGYVKVNVDKDTGNVTSATYYFEWTLSLKAIGAQVSIPFGLQKDFTIAW